MLKEPIGVVGAIVPWNYPLLLLAWKLAPALAAGNTLVCKPCELTPLSTLALAPLFEHLPPGVGEHPRRAPATSARRSSSDARVDCVAFTGSVATGKKIAATCAERIARVNLEIGGKDPFIVCDDVAGDIGVAARGGAWAAFLNAGQVCTSAERFYVARAGLRRLRQRVRRAHASRCGSATRSTPTTDLGPMVSAAQREKVVAQVEAAVGGGRRGRHRRRRRRAGARALLRPGGRHRRAGGDRAPARGDVRPRRADRAGHDARRGDRAGQRHAASASARTSTRATSRPPIRCLREMRAGTVWINDPLTDNDAGPFGGFKQSGLGRELGAEGLEAFRETKHVHIETKIGLKDWWYPYGK